MSQKRKKKYRLKIQGTYKVKPIDFEALFLAINMGLAPVLSRKYGLNRGRLETLCIGWQLQQEKHGYFNASMIEKRVNCLYTYSNRNCAFLCKNGFIEVAVVESSYRTKKYRLTAKGLAVIRDYSRTMRKAVEAALTEEFEYPE